MGLVGRINDSLNLSKDLFNKQNIKSSDPHIRNNELITFLNRKMTDQLILEKVNSASDQSIIKIESHFQKILDEFNSILNTFGFRFRPEILNPLLDLKRNLFTTTEFIRSFIRGSELFESEGVNFNAHLAGRISSMKLSLIKLTQELDKNIDYNKLKRTET